MQVSNAFVKFLDILKNFKNVLKVSESLKIFLLSSEGVRNFKKISGTLFKLQKWNKN